MVREARLPPVPSVRNLLQSYAIFLVCFREPLTTRADQSFAGTSEMLKNYSSIRSSSIEIREFVNAASGSVNNNQT